MLRRLLRNRWVAFAALAVLAVVVVLEVLAVTDDRSLPDAPDTSREVARDFAVAVTTFNHTRIDEDLARVLSLATEGFEREYSALTGPDYAEGIRANKRVSTGRVVLGPTVQRVTDGRAVFLVVVSQRVLSEGSDQPAQQLRVPMVLTVSTGDDPKIEAAQVLL